MASVVCERVGVGISLKNKRQTKANKQYADDDALHPERKLRTEPLLLYRSRDKAFANGQALTPKSRDNEPACYQA
jgi:hypothetical protein